MRSYYHTKDIKDSTLDGQHLECMILRIYFRGNHLQLHIPTRRFASSFVVCTRTLIKQQTQTKEGKCEVQVPQSIFNCYNLDHEGVHALQKNESDLNYVTS